MNILLTGASGFLGSYVIREFEKKKELQDQLIVVTGKDCSNYPCIVHNHHRIYREQFEKIGVQHIDVVLHLGGGVPTSSKKGSTQNMEPYIENIESTWNLISELPNIPSKFIFASSVMVYEDTQNIITENSKVNPSHLYGASKVFCEQLLQQWSLENQVVLQILRIGQCYGAGEESDLLIPTFIDKVLMQQKVHIYTDGAERRSFIHAQDVAGCIWKALSLKENSIINIASETSYSVKEMAEIICKIENQETLIDIQNQKIQTRNFIYDNQKMQSKLLNETVNFYDGVYEEYVYRKNR